MLILIATLIIGILVGVLAPGLFHKVKRRTGKANYHGDSLRHDQKANWFSETITRIVQPDSTQSQKVTTITKNAAMEIDSIESRANIKMSMVLDSVKVQLKPILNDEQWKRLQEFDTKAKSNWHRRRRGGNKH